jgi:hypothetical protein
MFESAATGLPTLDLSQIVLAIGALGTAAYGVVDVSKGFGGGISNRGFGDIKKVTSQLIPVSSGPGAESALSLPSVLIALRSNWLNGMALPDQKAVAKALLQLNLTADSAPVMAASGATSPHRGLHPSGKCMPWSRSPDGDGELLHGDQKRSPPHGGAMEFAH